MLEATGFVAPTVNVAPSDGVFVVGVAEDVWLAEDVLGVDVVMAAVGSVVEDRPVVEGDGVVEDDVGLAVVVMAVVPSEPGGGVSCTDVAEVVGVVVVVTLAARAVNRENRTVTAEEADLDK